MGTCSWRENHWNHWLVIGFPPNKSHRRKAMREREQRGAHSDAQAGDGPRSRATIGPVLLVCSASVLCCASWGGASRLLEGPAGGTGAVVLSGREHEAAPAGAGLAAGGAGKFRCFVVNGRARCVQAASSALARSKIVASRKEQVPMTEITRKRLREIREDATANQQAAQRLLVDEGWRGLEKSQQGMASVIAAKVRRLSRMVATLQLSNEGTARQLAAKASAPGPRGPRGPPGDVGFAGQVCAVAACVSAGCWLPGEGAS